MASRSSSLRWSTMILSSSKGNSNLLQTPRLIMPRFLVLRKPYVLFFWYPLNFLQETDYQRRVQSYQRQYQPLDEGHDVEKTWSFIKCDYFSKTFTLHNIRGHLPLKIANFVMNLRVTPHPFYLTRSLLNHLTHWVSPSNSSICRHGQSEYNVVGRIGGDSGLTEHGLSYARKLAQYVEYEVSSPPPHCCNLISVRSREILMVNQCLQGSGPVQWSAQSKPLSSSNTRLFSWGNNSFLSPSQRDRDEVDDTIEHKWVQMRGRQWFLLDEIFAGTLHYSSNDHDHFDW